MLRYVSYTSCFNSEKTVYVWYILHNLVYKKSTYIYQTYRKHKRVSAFRRTLYTSDSAMTVSLAGST